MAGLVIRRKVIFISLVLALLAAVSCSVQPVVEAPGADVLPVVEPPNVDVLLIVAEDMWRAFFDGDGESVYSVLSFDCRSELSLDQFTSHFNAMRGFYEELQPGDLADDEVVALNIRHDGPLAIVELEWTGPSPITGTQSSSFFLEFRSEAGEWRASALCDQLRSFE